MVLLIGTLPSFETGKNISQTKKLLSEPEKTRHTSGQGILTGKLLSKIRKSPEIGRNKKTKIS